MPHIFATFFIRLFTMSSEPILNKCISTIIVGGDLMENLDNDLDNFLNDLLKE